jgi:phenol 2-monooxygenase
MATPTPQKVDILIAGSGSAGLCAATWLARCGIPCKVLERRPGPMELGQADGVQCRTVEVFESFGMSEDLLREAYHVLEVAFWSSTDSVEEEGVEKGRKLVRTSRTADTMKGLSHQPHVILNQAKVNGFLIDAMRRWNGQEIDYGYVVKDVKVDSAAAGDAEAYPVTVTAEKDGVEEVFLAKYVLVSTPDGQFKVPSHEWRTGLRWRA